MGFFDRPKASARAAVQALSNLSVEVRVLTGDSASVARSTCSRLGIPADSVITGSMLQAMEESEALIRVGKARVFAELTPAQKAQIVSLIRLSGHIVGYIGDGVNDVPALTSADVGIVVDSAAAESKKVADLVLLARDVGVVAEGVSEGRTSFANASKYIRIASSSNFGNICSVAASSIFLPFVPATATQLLLLNLCYDATCLALSWDNVDDAEIARPRAGRVRGSAALCFILALRARPSTSLRLPFCSWAYAPPSAARPLPRSTRRVERPLSRPSKPAGCWNAHGPNRSCSWCCERAVSATGIVLAHRSW